MALTPVIVQDTPRQRREPRAPQHPFAVKHNPYQLAPFCIVPVRPGETLKNFTWSARAVSDPVKSALVGWHLEYYWFYVKFRDMQIADALTDMMITPDRSMTDVDDPTTDAKYYHAGTAGNINFTKECVKVITEWWFRNDGEAWDSATINGLPAASVNQNSWFDSITDTTTMTALDPSLTVGVDDVIKGSEVEELMRKWELLRMTGLTVQTYEEYLASHGVGQAQTEVLRPELLRYVKMWQYPSNTVEPTTGVPSSALSWTVQERADKDRYFKEPGFIIGITCARPKVYRSKQVGSLAHLMNRVYDWLPQSLAGDDGRGLKLIDNANALLSNSPTTDFWVDMADLFVYGDQFVNFTLTDTDMGLVASPATGSIYPTYLTYTMVQALFQGTSYNVRQDGKATFNILGGVHDAFPYRG